MAFYNVYTGSMDPKYSKEFAKPQIEKTEKPLVFEAKRLGAPGSPVTAKQLDEFGKMLNQGISNVEIGTLQLEQFETIPKQHFDEIRRLSVLTKANVSLHGPMIDLSGFGEHGWKEQQRKEAEQQMASVIKRAKELDKDGNIPIVFHAGGQSFSNFFDKKLQDEVVQKYEEEAQNYRSSGKLEEAKQIENGLKLIKDGKKRIVQSLGIVNQDSGEMKIVPFEKRKRIDWESGKEIEVPYDPYDRLDSINQKQWDDEKLKILSFQKQIDDIREKMKFKEEQIESLRKTDLAHTPKYMLLYEENTRDIDLMGKHIANIKHDMGSVETDVIDKFNKWATKEQREAFDEERKRHDEDLKKIGGEIRKYRDIYQEKIHNAKSKEEKNQLENEFYSKANNLSLEIDKIKISALSTMDAPKIWMPVEDFAQKQLAKTVSNALITFAKENKGMDLSKAPIIAMENWVPSAPMSTGETLKQAVEKTREEFAKKLSEDKDLGKKYTEKEAKEISKKLIGATWDMGHINQLRKSGYSEQELQKKVIEETQKVADVVKHVHITDNFGFTDSHLPPGMGNVPVKDILEKLEKQGYKGRGIVEAGAFVKEFAVSPTHGIFEYFNSPAFYDIEEARGRPRPYWSPERPNMYMDSYIEFPQQHFSLYGSSFSTLPKTFGGQVGGEKSRFSETPNQ